MYLIELGKYQSMIDVKDILYVDTYERVNEENKKTEYVLSIMFYTGGLIEYVYNSYEMLMTEFNSIVNEAKKEERKNDNGIF